MIGYLISLGFKTWKIFEKKYVEPKSGPSTDDISAYEENEKVRYAIYSPLSKTKRTKFISLGTTYEVWKKLQDIYEGNSREKLSKKLIEKCRSENLKMEEGEDIASYFQMVDIVENVFKN
jgi:hypothetical protein